MYEETGNLAALYGIEVLRADDMYIHFSYNLACNDTSLIVTSGVTHQLTLIACLNMRVV